MREFSISYLRYIAYILSQFFTMCFPYTLGKVLFSRKECLKDIKMLNLLLKRRTNKLLRSFNCFQRDTVLFKNIIRLRKTNDSTHFNYFATVKLNCYFWSIELEFLFFSSKYSQIPVKYFPATRWLTETFPNEKTRIWQAKKIVSDLFSSDIFLLMNRYAKVFDELFKLRYIFLS